MKTIEQWREQEQKERETAQYWTQANKHESALMFYAEATRIYTYIGVLEGTRPDMRECIEIWPSTEFTAQPGPPQTGKRHYQLQDTGNRRSIDLMARQAMERIAWQQTQRPTRKQMPAGLKFR